MKTIKNRTTTEIYKKLIGVRQKQVFKFLNKNEKATSKEIADTLDIDVVTTIKALDSLIFKGMAKRKKDLGIYEYFLLYDKPRELNKI